MGKFYNEKKQMNIDLSEESCDLETWYKNNSTKYSCCKHPDGFYIFLNSDEIKRFDEYKDDDDPYTTLKNLDSAFHQRRINCTIELIKNFKSNQNLRLLDLGCGQGHFTDIIKKHFQNYEVIGLDNSLTAIKYANSNYKNIDFIVANAYYPPFENEYFDIIVCNNIWEHVPDPLHLLNAINRILKVNGLLVITTPSRYRLANLLKVCLGKKISLLSNHVTEYTVGQITEQLKYGGFKINKIYSPAIKERKLVFRFIKFFLSLFLKVIKSHHILETTVFYSATKLPTQKIHLF